MDNTTYKPGDVANGHRLNDDGQWVPVEEAAPVEAVKPSGNAGGDVPRSTAERAGFRIGQVLVVIVGLLVVLFIGIAIGSAGGGDTPEARTVTETQTVEVPAEITQADKDALIKQGYDQAKAEVAAEQAAAQQAADAAKAANSFGPGTLVVGVDIQPGVYKTTESGYWARLSGLDGSFESIITNGNAEGTTTVEILSTDKAFETGITWTKVG